MESLKEAHKLLDRHIQSINKHSELEAVAHFELDEIKTECQSLRETLKKEKEEKQGLEDTLKTNKAEWEEQVCQVHTNTINNQQQVTTMQLAPPRRKRWKQ